MSDQFSNDDLQSLWDNQPEQLTIPNMKELTMSVQKDYRKEQKRLFLLNLQEVIPATLMSLGLGWQATRATDRAWAWIAASLISLAVGGYLVATSVAQRRREQALDNDARGELERSLSQVTHRARLYRSVAWWYLAPVAVVIMLIMVASGTDFASPATLVYLAVVASGLGLLYRWNHKIARDEYEPKAERLSRLIADLG